MHKLYFRMYCTYSKNIQLDILNVLYWDHNNSFHQFSHIYIITEIEYDINRKYDHNHNLIYDNATC